MHTPTAVDGTITRVRQDWFGKGKAAYHVTLDNGWKIVTSAAKLCYYQPSSTAHARETRESRRPGRAALKDRVGSRGNSHAQTAEPPVASDRGLHTRLTPAKREQLREYPPLTQPKLAVV